MTNDDIQVAYDVGAAFEESVWRGAAGRSADDWPKQKRSLVQQNQLPQAEQVKAQFERATSRRTKRCRTRCCWIRNWPTTGSERSATIRRWPSTGLLDWRRSTTIMLCLMPCRRHRSGTGESSHRQCSWTRRWQRPATQVLPAGAGQLPLVDAWTWREELFRRQAHQPRQLRATGRAAADQRIHGGRQHSRAGGRSKRS